MGDRGGKHWTSTCAENSIPRELSLPEGKARRRGERKGEQGISCGGGRRGGDKPVVKERGDVLLSRRGGGEKDDVANRGGEGPTLAQSTCVREKRNDVPGKERKRDWSLVSRYEKDWGTAAQEGREERTDQVRSKGAILSSS